jgi:rhamnogalacturonyl hydrolase YesR
MIPCHVAAPSEVQKALASAVVNAKPSAARLEMRRRVARTAVEVATELAQVYGHKLDPVAYIPALAIVGRMRLGELTGDHAALRDVEKICLPYKTGDKESMPANGNGGTISGHLVFAELARRTGDPGWMALVKKAADYGFDADGRPKESMPFHSEMSDSVFMGCAILAEAGRLTRDKKYFEHCLRHLRFMEKRCLRADGIYRHSPLDESAWGRGNGFPALGLSLSLSQLLPSGSAEHTAFLQSYRNHVAALRKHQDPTGAWHQVIDHAESYREFTSTCMITFAIVRGLRRGWLEAAEWQPVVDKAWSAIKSRIGADGHLVDVCTGTGKMKSLREYLDRTATLGRDDRGGAMALMVTTEIAFWEREKAGK